MSEKDGRAGDANPDALVTSATSDPNATLSSSAAAAFSAAERAAELKSIGPYQLIRKLGEGGMGQVWLAEQTAPLQRQVALKLIKVGRYDDSVLQRFYAERQSLAIMEHPAIAKVFDAGATPDGQPYFVMEYVPGVPITDYCDRKRLRIRERLELLVKVCEGVQHAHQKAIMHRDLKPANILVVEVDGKPVPRIIDFGLAKAASRQIDGQTMFTQAGGWVGTPGYMSPEQADPGVLDVDTRTDVYSLGAVLYELLTGFLPFETRDWRKQPFDEFLRHLREEDPPRPSTKVSTKKDSSKTAAVVGGTEPRHLVSLLHGDLDWITMKALEKDRSRRYGTPSELAADIERYLRHEPVVARPASPGYRLRKYVRRHRLGVAVIASLVLLLAGFAVMQSVQVRRITRERDRANRITAFMTDMFKVSDPNEAHGNSVTAREILEKSSKEIETKLSSDPELQSQLMGTMGHVYANLGLLPQAENLLRDSVAAGRKAGTLNPNTLNSMGLLAFLLLREGRHQEADSLLAETIEGSKRTLGPHDPLTLVLMGDRAQALEDEAKYPEAEKLLRDELDLSVRYRGAENADTLLCMNQLANDLDDESRLPEAEQLYQKTLEIQKRTRGAEDPDTLSTASNLASVFKEEGRLDEAEKLQRETLAARTRVLGPEHPDTLAGTLNLANTLTAEKRYSEAEALYRPTLEAQRRVMGPENPETLATVSSLANCLRNQGRLAEAEKLQRQAVDGERRIFGPEHPETLDDVVALASILLREGKVAEARTLYSSYLDAVARTQSPAHLATFWYNYACAAALGSQSDLALENLQQAVERGFSDASHMAEDDDLKSLRSDPRFTALLARAKEKAAASQSSPAQKSN